MHLKALSLAAGLFLLFSFGRSFNHGNFYADEGRNSMTFTTGMRKVFTPVPERQRGFMGPFWNVFNGQRQILRRGEFPRITPRNFPFWVNLTQAVITAAKPAIGGAIGKVIGQAVAGHISQIIAGMYGG